MIADRSEANHNRVAAHLEQLKRSVFARAFCGELVPTEAELAELEGRSFESAEELLVRM